LPTTACACKIRQDLFSTGHRPDAQAERDPQSKLQKGISMAQTIEIKSRGVNAMNAIGWVTFDENPVHLQVHRTANGFNLQLPIEISLALVGSDENVVSDKRGIYV
jgi:hypothetical protein